MLSRKTWFALAAVVAVFALWYSMLTVEVIYSERNVDGVIVTSGVTCGNGLANVFFGEYDDSVLGPATQSDCLKASRTRVLEVGGLLAIAGVLVFIGAKYGKQPPSPIDSELPRLPEPTRSVEGRRKRETS